MAGRKVEIDEILDAGVGAGSGAEVDGEFKVGVLAGGENIAGVATLFAPMLGNGEEAVFDFPAESGEVGAVGAVPARGCFSVEEEVPALSSLLG